MLASPINCGVYVYGDYIVISNTVVNMDKDNEANTNVEQSKMKIKQIGITSSISSGSSSTTTTTTDDVESESTEIAVKPRSLSFVDRWEDFVIISDDEVEDGKSKRKSIVITQKEREKVETDRKVNAGDMDSFVGKSDISSAADEKGCVSNQSEMEKNGVMEQELNDVFTDEIVADKTQDKAAEASETFEAKNAIKGHNKFENFPIKSNLFQSDNASCSIDHTEDILNTEELKIEFKQKQKSTMDEKLTDSRFMAVTPSVTAEDIGESTTHADNSLDVPSAEQSSFRNEISKLYDDQIGQCSVDVEKPLMFENVQASEDHTQATLNAEAPSFVIRSKAESKPNEQIQGIISQSSAVVRPETGTHAEVHYTGGDDVIQYESQQTEELPESDLKSSDHLKSSDYLTSDVEQDKKNIEIERKFIIPHDAAARLETLNAQFVIREEFIDVYYDTPSYDLTLADSWLRQRNGQWQLKDSIEKNLTDASATKYREYGEEYEILEQIKHLIPERKIDYDLDSFVVSNKIQQFAKIVTMRDIYSLGTCKVVLDTTDFGFEVGEIEIMVADRSAIYQAIDEIDMVASKLGFKSYATSQLLVGDF